MLTRESFLQWLSAFKNSPEIFVVHGEEETSLQFAEIIREQLGFTAHVPNKGEAYEL